MAKTSTTDAKNNQIDKFREAARQLETDDDEKRFDERLGKIAKTPPTKEQRTIPEDRK